MIPKWTKCAGRENNKRASDSQYTATVVPQQRPDQPSSCRIIGLSLVDALKIKSPMSLAFIG